MTHEAIVDMIAPLKPVNDRETYIKKRAVLVIDAMARHGCDRFNIEDANTMIDPDIIDMSGFTQWGDWSVKKTIDFLAGVGVIGVHSGL